MSFLFKKPRRELLFKNTLFFSSFFCVSGCALERVPASFTHAFWYFGLRLHFVHGVTEVKRAQTINAADLSSATFASQLVSLVGPAAEIT